MKENLRTTHFATGLSIELGNSANTTTCYRYYTNNDSSNVFMYGYLYNWKAAIGYPTNSSDANPSGIRGICPNGWHLPSSSEWLQLIEYVSSHSQYICSGNSSYIAKSLADTIAWNTSTYACAIGNNLSLNNSTGFSALPAGTNDDEVFGFGNYGYFWSTTESEENWAYFFGLGYYRQNLVRIGTPKADGISVRCVKD